MLVRERMTPNPVTVSPDTTVPDALYLMREKKVRRLPVMDAHGKLLGIVTDSDLLHASPSPATTLAVWEIPALIAKIKVKQVMSHEVITVPEDMPLEEAARMMADSHVGGLPVVRGTKLVGIITESDLFKLLLQMLGGRRPGVRLVASASGSKGTLARITSAIAAAGGDIVGLGVSEMQTSDDKQWEIVFKVQDVSRDTLVQAVRPLVQDILDVRDM